MATYGLVAFHQYSSEGSINDAYSVNEETTRNRILQQKLCSLIEEHGFGVTTNKLKGFTLPITEFVRSRNDHCLAEARKDNITSTIKKAKY